MSTSLREQPERPGRSADSGRRAARGNLYDVYAVLAAALLFTVALVVGRALEHADGSLYLRWPPMYAHWRPHLGPGTPAALALAALTVAYGPALARRLPWRALVFSCWGAAMAWSWSLALVDGWYRGVAQRLTTVHEYLRSVGEVHDLGALLRGFTDRIPLDAPGHWPAHVAGHPPGALLTFAGLDRLGLGGGGWAGVFVIVTGSSAVAAVLLTLRALCAEETARRAAPFLVLAPSAVWMGVSADGWFTAVGAWGLALLALSATRGVRAPWTAAAIAGLLFGLLCFLSYGLVLLGLLALAVLLRAHVLRSRGAIRGRGREMPLVRLVLVVLLGVLLWLAAFAAAGFWWFAGYATLVDRYYAGAGGVRPYGYFVWANIAVQAAVIGPAAVAGLRRAAVTRRGTTAVLLAGAVAALLLADFSGMSKAETERIWLPFTLWLLPAAALLPPRTVRWWLTAQAAVALTVNHLLNTGW